MIVERLSNGANIVLRKRTDVSSVSVQFWLKTGALWENDNNRGVAHFLEHMVFNGTKEYLPGEIEKIVENLGGELNAATSYDYTFYYITLPAVHFQIAIKLLKELVFFPLLGSAMVEKEKPIVLEEIARAKNNPKTLLWRYFLQQLYKETNYRFPILGSKDTVSSFSSETVKNFHLSHYHSENLSVAVSGNIDEKAFSIIEETLSDIPFGKRNSNIKPDKTKVLEKEILIKHPAVANVHTVMGWRLPGLIECSDSAVYAILESMFSYGRSSVFYQRIVEKGLAYGISAGVEQFLGGNTFYVYGITDEGKNGKFEEEVVSVLKMSVEKELFDFAKKKVLKAETFKLEAIESEAEEIGFSLTVLDTIEHYLNFIEKVKKLSFEEFLEKIEFLHSESFKVKLLHGKSEVVL